MVFRIRFCATLTTLILLSSPLRADDDQVAVSPKNPWGDFTVVDESEASGGKPWWEHVMLWIPNRVMDALDVVHLDLGIGPAVGVAARVTKYGQLGYRQIAPFSLRGGLFGRKAPVMVETSNEFGIGPGYVNSKDRKICNGEVGLGADLIIGGYVGVCSEELLDFLAGLVFLDVSNDDIK